MATRVKVSPVQVLLISEALTKPHGQRVKYLNEISKAINLKPSTVRYIFYQIKDKKEAADRKKARKERAVLAVQQATLPLVAVVPPATQTMKVDADLIKNLVLIGTNISFDTTTGVISGIMQIKTS